MPRLPAPHISGLRFPQGMGALLVVAALSVGACTPVGSAPANGASTAPPAPRAATAPDGHPTRVTERCDVPIGWKVAEIDPRFGLSESEAESAIREAARLWEEAADMPLFEHDPEEGFPIVFAWDERHERVQAELAGRTDIAQLEAEVRSARAELSELEDRVQVDRRAHNRRVEALDRRRAEFRNRLEAWQASGSPPGAEARAIEAERQEINAEVARVNRDAEALEALTRTYRSRVDEVNGLLETLNARQRQVTGTGGIMSGFYREGSRSVGSWLLAVYREIFIYQYDDFDHLLRVVAHELGHALGVEPVANPDAIMYRNARSTRPGTLIAAGVQLHPDDVAALGAACQGRVP